jgi:hypothetical protein
MDRAPATGESKVMKDEDLSIEESPAPEPSVGGGKLDADLVAVVERAKKGTAIQEPFIRDGKAEVRVWLSDVSQKTIAKLKALGFEVMLEPKSAKLVIGRIAIEKLEALTKIDEVRLVTPFRR